MTKTLQWPLQCSQENTCSNFSVIHRLKKSRFITSFYKSLHFSPLSETSWYSQKYSPTKERICYLANWRTLSQTKNYWELSCLSKTIYHHQTQILTFWNQNHSYMLAKPIPSVTTHEYAAYLFTFSCPYW